MKIHFTQSACINFENGKKIYKYVFILIASLAPLFGFWSNVMKVNCFLREDLI